MTPFGTHVHDDDISACCRYPGCQRPAVVEVFDNHDKSHGVFCQPHGRQLQAALEKGERAAHGDLPAATATFRRPDR